MIHWIFVSTKDIFEQRRKDKFWGLGEHTDYRGELTPGDQVVFYIKGGTKAFVGSTTLKSVWRKLSPSEKRIYGHSNYPDFVTDHGVYLNPIIIWKNPLVVDDDLVEELDFFQNKEQWWSHLQGQGGVKKLSEKDFQTLIGLTSVFILTKDDFDACKISRETAGGSKNHIKPVKVKFKERLKPGLIDALGGEFADFQTNKSPYVASIRTRHGGGSGRYRDHMWLGMAHKKYEDPRTGVQFQFGINKDSVFSFGIWVEGRGYAPHAKVATINRLKQAQKEIVESLLQLNNDYFISARMDDEEKRQKTKEMSEDDLESWARLLEENNYNFQLARELSPQQAIAMGPSLTDHIATTFQELRPLYNLLAGISEPLELRREKRKHPLIDFWWVNQGETAEKELAGGLLWAPLTAKDGKKLKHHTDLQLAVPKDIIIHYSKGEIFAISQVISRAEKKTRPKEFPTDSWQSEGRLVKTKYYKLSEGIPLNIIDLNWRIEERGPFNRNGGVNQGYFYPLSEDFIWKLLGLSSELNELFLDIGINLESIKKIDEVGDPSKYADHEISLPKFPIDFYEHDYLNHLKNLLLKKQQIILYGPPGTGKTHLAIGLAQDIINNSNNIQVVQFHPSFGYEDFVEGIKVKTTSEGGNINYEVVPKIFRKACEKATKLKQENDCFILVIDEINRGDLGRIFGELILGLEYRNIPINTVYMDSPIIIPDNLLIIGTMNSVDRSIAIVDFALRRRFRFIKCMPQKLILSRWLDHTVNDDQFKKRILNLFEVLNTKIQQDEKLGEHHQIGHVFFFVKNKNEMEMNWDLQIRPLLEEYLNFNQVAIKDFDEIFERFKQ